MQNAIWFVIVCENMLCHLYKYFLINYKRSCCVSLTQTECMYVCRYLHKIFLQSFQRFVHSIRLVKYNRMYTKEYKWILVLLHHVPLVLLNCARKQQNINQFICNFCLFVVFVKPFPCVELFCNRLRDCWVPVWRDRDRDVGALKSMRDLQELPYSN